MPGIGELMAASFPAVSQGFINSIDNDRFWYVFLLFYIRVILADKISGGWEKNMMGFADVGTYVKGNYITVMNSNVMIVDNRNIFPIWYSTRGTTYDNQNISYYLFRLRTVVCMGKVKYSPLIQCRFGRGTFGDVQRIITADAGLVDWSFLRYVKCHCLQANKV